MKWYLSVLGALAVWRLTHLLHAQAGPRRVLESLRRWAGESSSLACFYCLSLWVSVPVALVIGQDWLEQVLLWLALSTTAIALDLLLDLISRGTTPPAHMPPLTPSQMAQAMAERFFDEANAEDPAEPPFTRRPVQTH